MKAEEKMKQNYTDLTQRRRHCSRFEMKIDLTAGKMFDFGLENVPQISFKFQFSNTTLTKPLSRGISLTTIAGSQGSIFVCLLCFTDKNDDDSSKILCLFALKITHSASLLFLSLFTLHNENETKRSKVILCNNKHLKSQASSSFRCLKWATITKQIGSPFKWND